MQNEIEEFSTKILNLTANNVITSEDNYISDFKDTDVSEEYIDGVIFELFVNSSLLYLNTAACNELLNVSGAKLNVKVGEQDSSGILSVVLITPVGKYVTV